MPKKYTFTVKFNFSIFGFSFSKEGTWNDISCWKEKIKPFAYWNSTERCWELHPELLVNNTDTIKQILKEIFEDNFDEQLFNYVVNQLKVFVDNALENSLEFLCPMKMKWLSNDTYRFYKQCLYRVRDKDIEFFVIHKESCTRFFIENEIGNPEHIAELVAKYMSEISPIKVDKELILKNIDKIVDLEMLESELAKRKTVILEEKDGQLVIKFPRRLSYEERMRILDAFSIYYYKQRLVNDHFELEPRRLTLVKFNEEKTELYGNYFIVQYLDVLRELGFTNIIDRVQWVERQVNVKKQGFELYNFQKEALQNWLKNGNFGTIVIPTGGGKTFIGLEAIATLRLPTLICVTTIELALQWKERIRKYLGYEAGILGGGFQQIRDITIAIYNSATKYIDKLKDRFGLVIFDEGHHVPAETFKEIALRIKAKYRLVLTATPKRFDQNEALIFLTCGKPVYSISYSELVKYGIVSPIKYHKIYVSLNDDERERYEEALQISSTPKRINELKKISFMAEAKYSKLLDIIRNHPTEKILVFCQYIEQARKSYELIRKIEPKCALVIGQITNGQRKRIFDAFRRGDIRIIVTTTVLDEGIDVPDAEVCIIMSGTGQPRQMIQRIGRVIRWRPEKIAYVYEIVTRGTIEERLSENRYPFDVFDLRKMHKILEEARKKYLNKELQKLVKKWKEIEEGKRKVSEKEKRELLEKIRALYRMIEV